MLPLRQTEAIQKLVKVVKLIYAHLNTNRGRWNGIRKNMHAACTMHLSNCEQKNAKNTKP